MPEIKVNIPDAPEGAREITLPSGAKAALRPGTGKDLRLAQTLVGQPFDAMKFEYALIAQTVMIAGKRVTMEMIDAMALGDVLALQGEVGRLNFPTRGPAEAAAS